MSIDTSDIVPFSQVRSRLTELAEAAKSGREKIVTRNGEAYVALIDASRLDYYHRLEREHIHLLLLQEVSTALTDIQAGRLSSIESLRAKYGRE
ncbi:type II toxin-antitoxin system Phd/YefM family antitoxin [Thermithiobacillus plumbiphilus]|uniref:Type II toxin-antitoxin system Phd/YefM family antitoxin n=1 Tax=Thermithiobacillus plumbiphilus TaxID=1729899 RepID=A0ABU9DDJ8_9PROT